MFHPNITYLMTEWLNSPNEWYGLGGEKVAAVSSTGWD